MLSLWLSLKNIVGWKYDSQGPLAPHLWRCRWCLRCSKVLGKPCICRRLIWFPPGWRKGKGHEDQHRCLAEAVRVFSEAEVVKKKDHSREPSEAERVRQQWWMRRCWGQLRSLSRDTGDWMRAVPRSTVVRHGASLSLHVREAGSQRSWCVGKCTIPSLSDRRWMWLWCNFSWKPILWGREGLTVTPLSYPTPDPYLLPETMNLPLFRKGSLQVKLMISRWGHPEIRMTFQDDLKANVLIRDRPGENRRRD